jgi:hypothetical protein
MKSLFLFKSVYVPGSLAQLSRQLSNPFWKLRSFGYLVHLISKSQELLRCVFVCIRNILLSFFPTSGRQLYNFHLNPQRRVVYGSNQPDGVLRWRIGSYLEKQAVKSLCRHPEASVYFDLHPRKAFLAEHVLDMYVPLCLIGDLRAAAGANDAGKFFGLLVAHHKSLSVVESAPSTVADGEGL